MKSLGKLERDLANTAMVRMNHVLCQSPKTTEATVSIFFFKLSLSNTLIVHNQVPICSVDASGHEHHECMNKYFRVE